MEKRAFKVAPNIIMSLVKAQAGSLGKGVAECVGNSYDAGASRVDIEIDSKGLVVRDDGRGFANRKEIEEWFEVFGFEHDGDSARKMGAFGIGRAQLWAFATTVWRTNQFEMAVDIKGRGLDYLLKEGLPKRDGVEIRASFYEKLTTYELQSFEKEIEDLVRYFQIPVYLNGERISKDPLKEKWTHETDDAWIKLNPSGRVLTLYNLGMKVTDYGSYKFGVGGVVVTKPGVKLALNMARNSVLESECKVWKRIVPRLRKEGESAAKRQSLTEDQLGFMANELLVNPMSDEAMKAKVFVDVRGRKFDLETFCKRLDARGYNLTVAPQRSARGDFIEQHKLGVCLSDVVLARFGVEDLDGLVRQLKKAAEKTRTHDWLLWQWRWTQDVKAYADVAKFPATVDLDYRLIEEKSLTPPERMALAAIRKCANPLHWDIRARYNEDSEDYQSARAQARTIKAGDSELAEAWTDGSTYIAINRKVLKAIASKGLRGCMAAATLLTHEYLHDSNTAGSHSHDLEFMEAYHELTCGLTGGSVQRAADELFRAFLTELRRRKLPIPQAFMRTIMSLEDSEKAGGADMSPEAPGDDVPDDDAAPQAPRPRLAA